MIIDNKKIIEKGKGGIFEYTVPIIQNENANNELIILKYMFKLSNLENNNLRKRINKAIEFINANKWNGNYGDDYDIFLCEEDIIKLEKILKENNNGN